MSLHINQHQPAFADYLVRHQFNTLKTDRSEYVVFEGLSTPYVYVVKSGVVKLSTFTADGREFNIKFIKAGELVTLLGDEVSEKVTMPFTIKTMSEYAEVYRINRVRFWHDVNTDPELAGYIKEYYRSNLEAQIRKTQMIAINGKFGAVCAQLYELFEMFGKETPKGFLIDFPVTNEELAKFCGITHVSSISRMLRKLKDLQVITMDRGTFYIQDLAKLHALALGDSLQ